MKVKVWKIGKPAHREYSSLTQKFIDRLKNSFQFECEIIRLADEKKQNDWEQRFFLQLQSRDFVVAMDERGKALKSTQFAGKIKEWQQDQLVHTVHFVIGGPYGLSQEFMKKCQMNFRLTDMVLPSDMAWLVLCEQIYRAHCINTGNPYHHV